MEHYRPAPGTPLKDLDTPCLLIDLDAVEHNFRRIADMYRDTVCKMRTHVKNLKSPLLAHMQIRAGGTVGGVCAAKVAEAEVMVEGGHCRCPDRQSGSGARQDCAAVLTGQAVRYEGRHRQRAKPE